MLITLRGQKVKNVQTKRTLLGLVDLLKITISYVLHFAFCGVEKITKFKTHEGKSLWNFHAQNLIPM